MVQCQPGLRYCACFQHLSDLAEADSGAGECFVSNETCPHTDLQTFPKKNDGESSTGKNPIYPFTKARLPSPGSLLQYLQDKKITTAALTVKNVMECMRALELDGKVETIKPLSMGHFDLGDDQPGPSKRRKTEDDDSDSDYDVRKEKEKLKLKERAKEKKRRAKEKEKKEKERKEKEKAKDKKRKKKEKEKEKKKKRKKEKVGFAARCPSEVC